MSNDDTSITDAAGALGLFQAAANLTTDTARWGLRIASLPILQLPSTFRSSFLGTTRMTLEAMRMLPDTASRTLQALAHDVDDLEARSARREDLGRRLRRDERRRLREGS